MDRVLRNLALTLLLSSPVHGDTGTADALILAVPGFAEQMRMGEAGWALGGAAWAAAGNPSSMAPGFSASGGRWTFETSSASAAAAIRPAEGLCAGGFFRYVGRGGLAGRDASGVATGEYSWSSGSAGVAGSFPLPLGTRGGVSFGTVWEKIEDTSASGVIFSAGLSACPLECLDTGLAVLNFGSAPSWDGVTKNLPTEVSAGSRWRALPFLSVVAGAVGGFWTSSRFSLAVEPSIGGLSASAGWTAVPGQEHAGGFFGGLAWEFVNGSEYSAEFALRQVGDLSWPVSAGISVEF
jgi:hypothetical protein